MILGAAQVKTFDSHSFGLQPSELLSHSGDQKYTKRLMDSPKVMRLVLEDELGLLPSVEVPTPAVQMSPKDKAPRELPRTGVYKAQTACVLFYGQHLGPQKVIFRVSKGLLH